MSDADRLAEREWKNALEEAIRDARPGGYDLPSIDGDLLVPHLATVARSLMSLLEIRDELTPGPLATAERNELEKLRSKVDVQTEELDKAKRSIADLTTLLRDANNMKNQYRSALVSLVPNLRSLGLV